jgi:hypothetical protein
MRRWIVQGLLPALAPVLVLVGVIAWGQYSRDRLRTQDRYRLPFATIDCPSPPSLSRDDFLNEVQYQSSLPDRVDLLDGDTPERLRQAFARHPWVERVDRVEILPEGGVRVDLVYRAPVLLVSGKSPTTFLTVDRNGVRLPSGKLPERLPRWSGPAAKPPQVPGTAWGDARIESAARLAELLLPHLDRLCPSSGAHLTLQVKDQALVVSGGAVGQAIWGHAPGQEAPGEPSAAMKLRRLLERAGAAPAPIDLRTVKSP